MADDKTEQPSPKKLREARKKGQVAKSNDLTQAVLFITAGAVLSFSGGAFVSELKAFMLQAFDPVLLSHRMSQNELIQRIGSGFAKYLLLSTPLLGALVIMAAAANFLQIGGLIFSPEALSPKFEKLNPVQGFQNLFFKSKTYIELIKNLVKFSVVIWLAYSTISADLRNILLSARINLQQTAALTANLMSLLLFKTGGAFLVIGGADFLVQKFLFLKELKMSKEEVKREYKEDEGDPHIKHARKHLHMEMLHESTKRNVPKATAVVVNPTHLAIALKYDQGTMAAPQVTAKGQMLMAQEIIKLARRHHVPVVRNIPLAHSLYELQVGDHIPETLYEAVAEVLNFVYELSHKQDLA